MPGAIPLARLVKTSCLLGGIGGFLPPTRRDSDRHSIKNAGGHSPLRFIKKGLTSEYFYRL